MSTTYRGRASTTNPASEKQIAFARKLVLSKEVPTDVLVTFGRIATLSRSQASVLIDTLLGLPDKAVEPTHDDLGAPTHTTGTVPSVVNEIGVFVSGNGAIFKTQANRQTKRLYVKRWHEIGGERLLDKDGVSRVRGEWEYDYDSQPTWKQIVNVSRKMTLDEAKEFILRYGKCVRCGRHLKAAESVERGIGPVCVTYFSF